MERNDTVRRRIMRYAAEHATIDAPTMADLLHAKRSTMASYLSHLSHAGYLMQDGIVRRTGRKLYRITPRGRDYLQSERTPKIDISPLAHALGYKR